MPHTILVLGATGLLGQPVARSLKDGGYNVRVMTRSADRARQVLGEGFEIVEGNAAAADDLAAALDGCAAAHVSLETEVELAAVRHVTALAAKHPLERITYVSACTVAEQNRWFELVDVKMRAEQVLRSSGVPHTIFCPTWVMEVLKNMVHGDRAVVLMSRRPIPLHFFAAADFGRMVAAAYGKAETLGRRLYVHGPEATELQAATERFVAACHPEAQVIRIPVWVAKVFAALSGRKRLTAACRLIDYFVKVGEMGDPTEANDLLGAPTITLDDWFTMQKG